MRSLFIVDDDPNQSEILKDYFMELHDVKIQTFRSGEECLKNLDKNPDIIFLDYNFDLLGPDAMSGIEILKQIKAQKPQIEVVMFTGEDKLEIAVNCKKYGAFDYVVKGGTAFHRAENAFFNINRLLALELKVNSVEKDLSNS